MEEVDGLMLIHHLAAFVFCILIFCILASKATVGCSVFRMEEEIKCVQYSPPQSGTPANGLSHSSYDRVSISSILYSFQLALVVLKPVIIQ